MKHLKDFVSFNETFKPKKLVGRKEAGEKKGIINWIEKAKEGKLKDLEWEEGFPEDVVFDDIDVRDIRVCIMNAYLKEDMLLSTLYKLELKGSNILPWVLTIEDDSKTQNVSKERFSTFEEGKEAMTKYFGVEPEEQKYYEWY